jgi:hypothetical protein
MIGVDKIGEIRRAYFEQHRSIKEIVRTLSVSRATVRKVRRKRPPTIARLSRSTDLRPGPPVCWHTCETKPINPILRGGVPGTLGDLEFRLCDRMVLALARWLFSSSFQPLS